MTNIKLAEDLNLEQSLQVLTRLKLSGYVRRMRGAIVADTALDMSRLCDLSCVISGTQDSQKR